MDAGAEAERMGDNVQTPTISLVKGRESVITQKRDRDATFNETRGERRTRVTGFDSLFQSFRDVMITALLCPLYMIYA